MNFLLKPSHLYSKNEVTNFITAENLEIIGFRIVKPGDYYLICPAKYTNMEVKLHEGRPDWNFVRLIVRIKGNSLDFWE